jgi:hypothetical protein
MNICLDGKKIPAFGPFRSGFLDLSHLESLDKREEPPRRSNSLAGRACSGSWSHKFPTMRIILCGVRLHDLAPA